MKANKAVSRVFLAATIAATIIICGFNFKSIPLFKHSGRADTGFAVVELFTSEGCSSCPPADEVVARLLNKRLQNVYILSFHVDYWNRLGWNDPFSKAAFSERQKQYAKYFSLKSIYTPQIVINGSSQFVGSNEGTLNAGIERSLGNGEQSGLTIDTERKRDSLIITHAISGLEPVFLNVALVQPAASTVVQRGENKGKTLHHINIVRSLNSFYAKGKGHLTILIPEDLTGTPLQVIAYTQSRQNFRVLGAALKKL